MNEKCVRAKGYRTPLAQTRLMSAVAENGGRSLRRATPQQTTPQPNGRVRPKLQINGHHPENVKSPELLRTPVFDFQCEPGNSTAGHVPTSRHRNGDRETTHEPYTIWFRRRGGPINIGEQSIVPAAQVTALASLTQADEVRGAPTPAELEGRQWEQLNRPHTVDKFAW